MFGLYLCRYLLEKNKISQSEFEELLLQLQKNTTKLGMIAVAEKLLTAKQAEEIHQFQKKMDRRFGDIAIEKGYLLQEEVTYLLNQQGNSYLKFVQFLTESHRMTMQEVELILEEYKTEHKLSTYDLDALKSDDINRILPVFIDTDIPFLGECVSLLIRNIIRFINNDIIIKQAYQTKKYNCSALACQKLQGTHTIFIGCAGSETMSETIHSLCEIIHCSNTLYVTKLCSEGVKLDVLPPGYYIDKTLISEADLYIVPILINSEPMEIIISIDDQVTVI